MGTNYYGMQIPTTEDKEKIKRAIDEDDWGTVNDLIPTRIHLGKSSAGWQFLFNHNNWKYYGKSNQSMRDFIHSCAITDEYGRSISQADFWEKVKSKENDHLGDDIIVDGLRFAKYTDFC